MAKFLVIAIFAVLIIGLDGAPAAAPKATRAKRYVLVRDADVDAGAANQVRNPRAPLLDVNARGLLAELGLVGPSSGRVFIARDAAFAPGGAFFFSNGVNGASSAAEFETLISPDDYGLGSSARFVSPRFFSQPGLISINAY